MIISVCGPVGLQCARRLYEENKEQVDGTFAGFFVKQFLEIEPAGKAPGAVYAAELKENGLFGALWELGEELNCGMEVGLEAIPVRQEIVEVLELFKESPYECASSGSFVVASDLPEGEVPDGCIAIGRTTEGKSRVINSAEGKRFLTPPLRQQKDISDRKNKYTGENS